MDEWSIFGATAFAIVLSVSPFLDDGIAAEQAVADDKAEAIKQARQEHRKQQAWCIKTKGWNYIPSYEAGKAGCTNKRNRDNHIYPVGAV